MRPNTQKKCPRRVDNILGRKNEENGMYILKQCIYCNIEYCVYVLI